MQNEESRVIDLNVGGYHYSTTLETIKNEPENLLIDLIESSKQKIGSNRIFIDRDGKLFRFILDYLRNKSLILPENFSEKTLLKREAVFFKLKKLVDMLEDKETFNEFISPKFDLSTSSSVQSKNNITKSNNGGCITIGYRGTFSNGRDGMSDVIPKRVCILP